MGWGTFILGGEVEIRLWEHLIVCFPDPPPPKRHTWEECIGLGTNLKTLTQYKIVLLLTHLMHCVIPGFRLKTTWVFLVKFVCPLPQVNPVPKYLGKEGTLLASLYILEKGGPPHLRFPTKKEEEVAMEIRNRRRHV